MEELRSTEILDKEIQEDARKKADRILKNAAGDAARIISDVENRVAATRKEKEAVCKKRIEAGQRDADAAIPLEKERFLVSFQDKAIMTAIEEYYAALSEEKQLTLIRNLLKQFKGILNDKQGNLCFNGFSEKAVKKLVQDELGSSFILSMTELDDAHAREKEAYRGLVIETSDGSIRCRVTVPEIFANLIDANRYELVQALFESAALFGSDLEGGRLSQ
jgi:V/A-type H+-transporting ATPase subunit E